MAFFNEAYRLAVMKDTPWAWYRMNETTGAAEMLDSSGNERHTSGGGGGTSRVNGLFGNAFDATGTVPQYRARPSLTALSVNWSVEFWVEPTGTISLHGNSQYAMTNGGNRWAFTPGGDATITTGMSVGTNGITICEHAPNHAYVPLAHAATLPSNAWTHVVWTCTNSAPQLYLNGLFVASNMGWVGGTRYAPNRIGTDSIYSAGPMGRMDEVSIYSTVLSPAQIAAHYNAATKGIWFGADSPMVMG